VEACIAGLPSSGGVVDLQLGTYQAGNFRSCVSTPNVTLAGAGMPDFSTDYSHLVGGTVIQGTLSFCANNLTIRSLGVDVGSAWVAAGHAVSEGIMENGPNSATSSTTDPILRNVHIESVSVLESANDAPVHGLLIEHAINVAARDIHTVFGGHGFALKSSSALVDGLYASANAVDCLVIKADAYTQIVENIQASNISCKSLHPGDTGAGVVVEATGMTGEVSRVQVSNLATTGAFVGAEVYNVSLVGAAALSGIEFSNVSVEETPLPRGIPTCLMAAGTAEIESVQISNVSCKNDSGEAAAPLELYVPLLNSKIVDWYSFDGGWASSIMGTLSISGWQDTGPATVQPTWNISGANTQVCIAGYESDRDNAEYTVSDDAVVNSAPGNGCSAQP
jgi:hypothetical protein